ncbi:MAG: SDR family NAD(P)-dependent oxidoreductase [Streptosporangiales bacterium]
MTPIPGARVLVTGASSGIGRAVAVRCARAGGRVTLIGRDEARLAQVADETGGTPIRADLSVPGEPARIAGAAGPVDVLVNNAGAGLAGELDATEPSRAAALVQTNFVSALELTRAVLPGMRERGRGHLVMVTSIAARVPVGGESVYGATKAALDQFAAALRLDLSGTGIGVSTVVPGAVATDFFNRRGRPYDRRTPRPIPPERVADAVLTAIERDLPEVIAPRWLRLAIVARAVTPRLFDRLSARFGGS